MLHVVQYSTQNKISMSMSIRSNISILQILGQLSIFPTKSLHAGRGTIDKKHIK